MGFGGVIRCGHCRGGGVTGWRGRFDIQTGNGRGFHVLKKKINKKIIVVEIRGIMIIILTDITYKNLRWSMEARKEKIKRRGRALRVKF